MSNHRSKIFIMIQTLIPAVVSLFLIVLFFYTENLYPFSRTTIAWADMKQQVIPLMLQWREIVTGESNIFFNMLSTGGASFWSIFFFFVSSPFSILVFFIEKQDLVFFVNVIVGIKIAMSALTASLFFRFGFKNLMGSHINILSIIYAFSGFSLMFYQNMLWLDFVILFPLLLLGLMKIFSEGRYVLYLISLTLMLITSFYMSYMLVLFIILYSFIMAFDKKSYGSSYIKLILSSLASALISSFVWIPSYFEYRASARTISLFESLRTGRFIAHYETTFGIIFSSAILFTAIPLYIFFHSKYNRESKRFSIIFFAMLLPLIFEPVNKMWHTGSYQAFPARYGYICILSGLAVIASVLSSHKNIPAKTGDFTKKRKIWTLMLFFATLSIIVIHYYMTSQQSETISVYARTLWGNRDSFILLSLVFMISGIVYLGILFCGITNRINKKIFVLLISIILLSEIYFNLGIYLSTPSNDTAYYDNIFDLEDQIDDDSFYRVKSHYKYFDVNLTGALGYNSLSTYTSLTPEKYMFTMKRLGYSSYWMEVGSSHGTALTDALMSIKYTIDKYDSYLLDENEVYTNDDYRILNSDALNIPALVLDKDVIESLKTIDMNERLPFQNKLYRTISGNETYLFVEYGYSEMNNIEFSHEEDYLINILDDQQDAYITYDIHIDGSKHLYFDLFDQVSANLEEHINDSLDIYVNGRLIHSSYPNKSSNGILDLGEFMDESVSIKVFFRKNVKAASFGLFGMDKVKLSNFLEDIKSKEPLSFQNNENKLHIQINGNNAGKYIALFVPDSASIKVFSEENTIEHETFLDSFICFKIPHNAYDFTVRSIPKGFVPGIIISAVSLLSVIIFIFLKKTQSVVTSEKYMRIFIIIACALVLTVIYIFPIIYYLYHRFI